MAEFERDPNEIGVLWLNTSKGGKEYYKGTINGEAVLGWKKTVKGDKQMLKIVKQMPKEETPF